MSNPSVPAPPPAPQPEDPAWLRELLDTAGAVAETADKESVPPCERSAAEWEAAARHTFKLLLRIGRQEPDVRAIIDCGLDMVEATTRDQLRGGRRRRRPE